MRNKKVKRATKRSTKLKKKTIRNRALKDAAAGRRVNPAAREYMPRDARVAQRSRLTWDDAKAIKQLLREGVPQGIIAFAFWISRSYVCKIGKGLICKAWLVNRRRGRR
jgi:hypothetical protein